MFLCSVTSGKQDAVGFKSTLADFNVQLQGTLTICTENLVIPGRIQMERFIPVECFRKKGNTFRHIPVSRFFRNSRKFLYHLYPITSARLFPRRQQCP